MGIVLGACLPYTEARTHAHNASNASMDTHCLAEEETSLQRGKAFMHSSIVVTDLRYCMERREQTANFLPSSFLFLPASLSLAAFAAC
jgi:hypothetical protein